MKNDLNVFSGKESLKSFFNPDNHPPLPLVELPDSLNPYRKKGIRIFAKMMTFLPLGNVKSLPALNMILQNDESGSLSNITNIIENSSGNTVQSLGIISRAFGNINTHAYCSHEVSPGKLQLLRFFGIKPIVNEEPICPDPADKTSGIYKSKIKSRRKGWWNPGQYDNEANPVAHHKWTGPQIWKQTKGKIGIFCAGLGTTGTMVGTGSYLKQKNKALFNLGIIREMNNPVPGVRTKNLLKQIAFKWQDIINYVEVVGTKQAYETSLNLCRNGLLAGPSSGFALAGLLNFFKNTCDKHLDQFRNKDGEIIAVFICPDLPHPYIEEYFQYLDSEHFPKIKNQELLLNDVPKTSIKKIADTQNTLIDPEDAYKIIYAEQQDVVWRKVNNGQTPKLQKNSVVLDIRTKEKFQHNHLPGSIHVSYGELLTKSEQIKSSYKNKQVCVLCETGAKSITAANLLRSKGVSAHSINGGIIEWSEKNLPRWRPELCVRFQQN